MRSSIIGLAAMAALFALPEIASATDAGAAAGATTGAVAGAVVGGPVGAVVGAGAGAVVGGATSGPNTTGTVIVEERPPATREQTCIQDFARQPDLQGSRSLRAIATETNIRARRPAGSYCFGWPCPPPLSPPWPDLS